MADQLTTLINVKAWLNTTQTTDDALLTRLIASASAFFLTACNRNSILQNTYTERRDGTGTNSLVLENGPVQSVNSVLVDNVLILPSPDGIQCGYVADFIGVKLIGYYFRRSFGNVTVVYVGGYPNASVTGEAHTIPVASPWQVTVMNAVQYAGSPTVSYASSGNPLTLVTGTPTTGQFSASSAGVLTFSAGDEGVNVNVGYQVFQVPSDVEQAVIELVVNKYKRRSHIGVTTEHTGTEVTVSYAASDITPGIRSTIQRYRNVSLVTM